MPRFACSTLLALVSLTAGSWVGLGAPSAEDTRALTGRLRAHLEPGISARAATPPPIEPPVPQVDTSLLPDPTPWPRLNPSASTRKAWLLAEGPARLPTDGRRLVTFTFDDGPFPETTPVVLRTLARHQVKAAFFFIGRYLDGDDPRAIASRETAKEVVAAGHFVGNHTHDHSLLTSLSHAQALAQIEDGASSIERAIGKRPVFFRPPYGQVDPWTQDRLRERGAELVLWSVEVGDMKRDDSAAMAESLQEQIEYAGGGVVLLHDIRWATIPALETLLTWLHRFRYDPARPMRVGYEVVDLAQYIRATASSPQPYADRRELERARSATWRKQHGDHPSASLERRIGDGDVGF